MSPLWLFCVCVTVIGSLGYNIAMKNGATAMSAFLFMPTVAITALVVEGAALLFVKYGLAQEIAPGFNGRGVMLAIGAGLAVSLIDISYFYALRSGSVIASQTFWTVGGTVVLTIFSYFFLNEVFTPMKLLGLALGVASLFLITR